MLKFITALLLLCRVDSPELRAALQAESAVLALLAKLDAAQVRWVRAWLQVAQ